MGPSEQASLHWPHWQDVQQYLFPYIILGCSCSLYYDDNPACTLQCLCSKAGILCAMSASILTCACTGPCHEVACLSTHNVMESLQRWTVPSISSWSGLQIGDRFKTLSLTLEMPFKDTIENPDPVQGWSPGRTKSFGASILNPIVDTVPSLDG